MQVFELSWNDMHSRSTKLNKHKKRKQFEKKLKKKLANLESLEKLSVTQVRRMGSALRCQRLQMKWIIYLVMITCVTAAPVDCPFAKTPNPECVLCIVEFCPELIPIEPIYVSKLFEYWYWKACLGCILECTLEPLTTLLGAEG